MTEEVASRWRALAYGFTDEEFAYLESHEDFRRAASSFHGSLDEIDRLCRLGDSLIAERDRYEFVPID